MHNKEKRRQFVSELLTLTLPDFRAPNVLPLYDAFFDGDSVYLAVEYMDRGSLCDCIEARRFWPPWFLLPPPPADGRCFGACATRHST